MAFVEFHLFSQIKGAGHRYEEAMVHMMNNIQCIQAFSCAKYVYLRQHLMPQFGGVEELKIVLSLRSETLLIDFLQVICMYASVDPITLLPILIIINVTVLQWTLQECGLL
jgi:hypothetical protein